MEDKSISIVIGNNLVTYKPDEANPNDSDFRRKLQAVAATKPGSLHELINRLADLQRREKESNIHQDLSNATEGVNNGEAKAGKRPNNEREITLEDIKIEKIQKGKIPAFTANIFIDGIKAGIAANKGKGAETEIWSTNSMGTKLLNAAKRYCSSLPALEIRINNIPVPYRVSLSNYIDSLIIEHQEAKSINRKVLPKEKKLIPNRSRKGRTQ